MALSPIRGSDTEALTRTVKLRFSNRQLDELDLVAVDLDMARSWVLREAIALGLPLFVEKVRRLRDAGLVPRGEYTNPHAAGSRRGPRSDGARATRWVGAPVRRGGGG